MAFMYILNVNLSAFGQKEVTHQALYSQLLIAVRWSPYYQHNVSKACVFVPLIDTLSQSKLDLGLTSTLLNSLPE